MLLQLDRNNSRRLLNQSKLQKKANLAPPFTSEMTENPRSDVDSVPGKHSAVSYHKTS